MTPPKQTGPTEDIEKPDDLFRSGALVKYYGERAHVAVMFTKTFLESKFIWIKPCSTLMFLESIYVYSDEYLPGRSWNTEFVSPSLLILHKFLLEDKIIALYGDPPTWLENFREIKNDR